MTRPWWNIWTSIVILCEVVYGWCLICMELSSGLCDYDYLCLKCRPEKSRISKNCASSCAVGPCWKSCSCSSWLTTVLIVGETLCTERAIILGRREFSMYIHRYMISLSRASQDPQCKDRRSLSELEGDQVVLNCYVQNSGLLYFWGGSAGYAFSEWTKEARK